VLKLADFWGPSATSSPACSTMYQPPTWVFIAARCDHAVLCRPDGAVGDRIVSARPVDWRAHVLLIGIILFISGIHAVVFGHCAITCRSCPFCCSCGGRDRGPRVADALLVPRARSRWGCSRCLRILVRDLHSRRVAAG
jgi:hypothetical protein